MWLKPFNDGYSVATVGVKPAYRNNGIAMIMYNIVIDRVILYSDSSQTPQARKLWSKLYKTYNVVGYSNIDNTTFKVKLVSSEL
jgi:hypothetical protein